MVAWRWVAIVVQALATASTWLTFWFVSEQVPEVVMVVAAASIGSRLVIVIDLGQVR